MNGFTLRSPLVPLPVGRRPRRRYLPFLGSHRPEERETCVMKRVRGWGLLTVVVAVALFAAACGDDSGSSSATTAAGGGNASTTAATADTGASTTAGAPVSGTLQGSGSSFSLAFQQEAAAEFNKANPGATSPTAAAARARAAPTWRTRWSTSPARTRRSRTPTSRPNPILYFPILLGADHGLVQPLGRRQAAALSPTRSPRSSSARSRTGTTRPSPPTTRASRCPTRRSRSPTAPTARARRRTSPSTSSPAAPDTWTLKSGSTVEWPADTQAGNGNPGVAQIVSRPTAPSATSTSPTPWPRS